MWLIIVVILAFVGSTWGSELIVDRVSPAEVKETLFHNCLEDHRFRRAYRQWGLAEKKSLKAEVRMNEAIIEVVNARVATGESFKELDQLGRVGDRVNTRLNEVRSRLDVLPVPQCEEE